MFTKGCVIFFTLTPFMHGMEKQNKKEEISTKESPFKLLAKCKQKQGTSVIHCTKEYIFSGFPNGEINVVDINTFETTTTFKAHEKAVTSISSIDDTYIVSGSEDGTINVWDKNFKKIATLKNTSFFGVASAITALCCTSTHYLISGSEDGTLGIWYIFDRNPKKWFRLRALKWFVCEDTIQSINKIEQKAIRSISYTGTGYIVFSCDDETIRILNVSNENSKKWSWEKIFACKSTINSIFCLRDKFIVSCQYDPKGKINIFGIASNSDYWKQITKFNPKKDYNEVLSGSCQDKTMALGTKCGDVEVWDVSCNYSPQENWMCTQSLDHGAPVTFVFCTQNNILSFSNDGTIKRWGIQQEK